MLGRAGRGEAWQGKDHQEATMYTVTFFNRRNGKAKMVRHYGDETNAANAARYWASKGVLRVRGKLRRTIDYNRIRLTDNTYYYSVKTQRYAIVSRGDKPASPPQIERRYWLRASIEAGRWLSAPTLAEAIELQREWAVAGPIYYGPEGTIERACA